LGETRLAGIFGTGATLQIDINLTLQIVMFVIVAVSLFYKNKKKFKAHGVLMGIAVILHVVSFVAVMGPIFFGNFSDFVDYLSYTEVQTTWIHAVPGAIAMVTGAVLVALWALNVSDVAACSRRKRLMDATVLFWLISLVFGVVTYILVYV
jgi:hypothetical protein